MKVTALAGGVGGAKLLVGLQGTLASAQDLTAVVNTADDAVIYGVHVSPDVDIVTYWLAGVADTQRGWGIAGDSFSVVESLRHMGAATWFSLGDRDFATCIFRTMRLTEGATPSAVADEIAGSLGVVPRVLPMSDDPVRTRVTTSDGRDLPFQEYFVKERTVPRVTAVTFAGIEDAKPAPGVLDAIASADRVIVCPSNPIVSIAPILSLPGVRDALAAHHNVVAVSPIIGGKALKGPADRLLSGLGHEPSAGGVARLYDDFCNLFVVDRADEHAATRIRGPRVVVLDTVMVDGDASARLARDLLAL